MNLLNKLKNPLINVSSMISSSENSSLTFSKTPLSSLAVFSVVCSAQRMAIFSRLVKRVEPKYPSVPISITCSSVIPAA